jgi:hypothetical protein
VPGRAETTSVQDDPVPAEGVIVVRIWWEQAGGGAFALRARVVSTLNVASGRSAKAAADTTGGILAAVRVSLADFVAAGPEGQGSIDG